jgi:hypothetical protein
MLGLDTDIIFGILILTLDIGGDSTVMEKEIISFVKLMA